MSEKEDMGRSTVAKRYLESLMKKTKTLQNSNDTTARAQKGVPI
jgi:hypothetical protein